MKFNRQNNLRKIEMYNIKPTNADFIDWRQKSVMVLKINKVDPVVNNSGGK